MHFGACEVLSSLEARMAFFLHVRAAVQLRETYVCHIGVLAFQQLTLDPLH